MYLLLIIKTYTMKTLMCDLCETSAQGETFDAWMNNLQPHYMEAHADVMTDPTKTKEDMQHWVDENKERFEAITENSVE